MSPKRTKERFSKKEEEELMDLIETDSPPSKSKSSTQLEGLFPTKERIQCKNAVLDAHYYMTYPKIKGKTKSDLLGQFKIEKSEYREKKSDIEDTQDEILRRLGQCHNLDEEINYLTATIAEWREYKKVWQYLESEWNDLDEIWGKDISKKLENLLEDEENIDSVRQEIIEQYQNKVENHFCDDGRPGLKRMILIQRFLQRELKERRKRTPGYIKNEYDDLFSLRPPQDKIPWGTVKSENSNRKRENLVELVYLMMRLFEVGALRVSKYRDVNQYIYNFFESVNDDFISHEIQKNSIKTLKQSVITNPDSICSEEKFEKGDKEFLSRISSIFVSEIDKGSHAAFLNKCKEKKLSVEQGFSHAISCFLEADKSDG